MHAGNLSKICGHFEMSLLWNEKQFVSVICDNNIDHTGNDNESCQQWRGDSVTIMAFKASKKDKKAICHSPPVILIFLVASVNISLKLMFHIFMDH